jgi:hypothetical protein
MKNHESINVKKKNKKIKKDKSEKHNMNIDENTLNEEKSSEEIGVVNNLFNYIDIFFKIKNIKAKFEYTVEVKN